MWGGKAMIEGVSPAMPELRAWLSDAALANSAASGAPSEGPEAPEARWRRAVEENVLDQLGNLSSYPCVQAGLQAGTLKLHGWVYDLRGGIRVYDADQERFAEPQAP